eukprot:scaffold78719_cov17-Tisochrysis_lutea.AAC.1
MVRHGPAPAHYPEQPQQHLQQQQQQQQQQQSHQPQPDCQGNDRTGEIPMSASGTRTIAENPGFTHSDA